MDLEEHAGRLLDSAAVLRHGSDLDLLVFFARHPRTLMASEQIAAFLGYTMKDVAASLELLLDAGFLTRTPHHRHVARMYVLAAAPPGDGWLPAIASLASTRTGRLALIAEIRRRSAHPRGGSARPGASTKDGMAPPLRFPQGRSVGTPSPRETSRGPHDSEQSHEAEG